LPTDLPQAIKQLEDHELDQLLAEVLAEQKRRGRKLHVLGESKRKGRIEVAPKSLTSGQVNAVRSAFKAGITPATIARQFGISQSNVRKALATEEPKR
jgi:DNA invertase Pin-like site-specific DNA recombinase